MQHIIFDLDGTLIDSKNEILKTYNIVFGKIPPKVNIDTAHLNYGLTIKDVLKSVYGSDSASIESAKQLFASIYDNSDFNETLLYDDVYDTLQTLKQGNHLYIATNKRYLPAIKILEAKNIRRLFTAVMANEMEDGITLTKRQMIAGLKHAGAFSDGFMVGDSIGDIEAGKEEGMLTVAVTYGYEKGDVLLEKAPTYLIERFHNLFTFVEIHNKER